MKVLEANLSSTLDSFRADMAGFRVDMAKREAEAVRRDLATRTWILTAIAAAFGIPAALITTLAALNLLN